MALVSSSERSQWEVWSERATLTFFACLKGYFGLTGFDLGLRGLTGCPSAGRDGLEWCFLSLIGRLASERVKGRLG